MSEEIKPLERISLIKLSDADYMFLKKYATIVVTSNNEKFIFYPYLLKVHFESNDGGVAYVEMSEIVDQEEIIRKLQDKAI